MHAFPEFMAFYFPAAATEIDWTRGYAFLDQELAQVVRDAKLGRRVLDKLVRVGTHDGAEQWVFVHNGPSAFLTPQPSTRCCTEFLRQRG